MCIDKRKPVYFDAENNTTIRVQFSNNEVESVSITKDYVNWLTISRDDILKILSVIIKGDI